MSTELVQRDITPMQMIQVAFDAAIKQGSAMDVVNVILEQQRWMIQHDEEQALNQALRRIQNNLKKIPKKGWNKETKSWFARSEDVDDAIEEQVKLEGMTLNFRPGISEKPDMVLMIGVLALGAFHKEYPLEMPADGKGAKGGGVMSRTHATGAAITYSKRYLKNMIFDLRFEEKDDDGNGAGASAGLNDEQFISYMDNIRESANLAELDKFYKAAYLAAEAINDWKSVQKFKDVKNARKKALGGA